VQEAVRCRRQLGGHKAIMQESGHRKTATTQTVHPNHGVYKQGDQSHLAVKYRTLQASSRVLLERPPHRTTEEAGTPASSSPSRKLSSAWLVKHTHRMGPTSGLMAGGVSRSLSCCWWRRCARVVREAALAVLWRSTRMS
jgi:hypothetical protein